MGKYVDAKFTNGPKPLSEDMRSALEMLGRGATTKEIAAVLGRSVDAVQQLIREARNRERDAAFVGRKD